MGTLFSHHSTKILIWGDSLSHYGKDYSPTIHDVKVTDTEQDQPGAILGVELAKQGYTVRIDANVSRSAYNFWNNTCKYQQRKAMDLLNDDLTFDPDVVILFIGLNDIGIDLRYDRRALQWLHDEFHYSTLVIIGPPTLNKYELDDQIDSVYNNIYGIFANVIDIRKVTSNMKRTRDGEHFFMNEAVILSKYLLKESAGIAQR